MFDWFWKAVDAVKNFASSIGSAVKSTATAIADRISDYFAWAKDNPWRAVVLAIGAIVGGLVCATIGGSFVPMFLCGIAGGTLIHGAFSHVIVNGYQTEQENVRLRDKSQRVEQEKAKLVEDLSLSNQTVTQMQFNIDSLCQEAETMRKEIAMKDALIQSQVIPPSVSQTESTSGILTQLGGCQPAQAAPSVEEDRRPNTPPVTFTTPNLRQRRPTVAERRVAQTTAAMSL